MNEFIYIYMEYVRKTKEKRKRKGRRANRKRSVMMLNIKNA